MTDQITTNSAGCGCSTACGPASEPKPKQLPIIWQRLVNDEGETCGRCGSTGDEIAKAVARLGDALRPLGIEATLETRTLDQAAFEVDPSQSNRIWIAGRPLEDWIDAGTGSSQCSTVCGDSQCRTVELNGTSYETVAAELIIEAGLMAAANLLAT